MWLSLKSRVGNPERYKLQPWSLLSKLSLFCSDVLICILQSFVGFVVLFTTSKLFMDYIYSFYKLSFIRLTTIIRFTIPKLCPINWLQYLKITARFSLILYNCYFLFCGMIRSGSLVYKRSISEKYDYYSRRFVLGSTGRARREGPIRTIDCSYWSIRHWFGTEPKLYKSCSDWRSYHVRIDRLQEPTMMISFI